MGSWHVIESLEYSLIFPLIINIPYQKAIWYSLVRIFFKFWSCVWIKLLSSFFQLFPFIQIQLSFCVLTALLDVIKAKCFLSLTEIQEEVIGKDITSLVGKDKKKIVESSVFPPHWTPEELKPNTLTHSSYTHILFSAWAANSRSRVIVNVKQKGE